MVSSAIPFWDCRPIAGNFVLGLVLRTFDVVAYRPVSLIGNRGSNAISLIRYAISRSLI